MSKATTDHSMHAQMFGPLSGRQNADNDLALASLGPVISGPILESHFELQILSEKGLRRLLDRIFDSLFLTHH